MNRALRIAVELLTSTEWHAYWKDTVDVNHREQPRGAHIADIVTLDGCAVEVQHKSMSATKISGRELDHGHMKWIWDARDAYRAGRLTITGFNNGFVTFHWKNVRRNIRACRREIFLDLWNLGDTNTRVLLRVQNLDASGKGTGHLITHHSMRLWITIGIPLRPMNTLPDGLDIGK
ncbi:hypothetical protein ACFXD5_15675 [Streptomyces sp. NPDC059385]|uniref:hypothetical protein n=1 Tax=Streptomyces sp. NPDC059385 TaxID=3346817 RepID=UPI00369891CE